MKNKILLLISAAAFLSSCSTAYKASQTPDDLYYSPATEVKPDSQDDYQTYNTDDRYLRMKAGHNALWSTIDDYSYWNDSRYDFGYSCTPSRFAFINSLNLYPFGWNYGYGMYGGGWYGWGSPHQTIVYYKSPRVYYGTNSKTNLTAYGNNIYNNRNNQTGFGGLFRRAFTNNNNSNFNNTRNGNNPVRTFNNTTPSSNAGGHSGGYNSQGSSGGTSRPSRPPQ